MKKLVSALAVCFALSSPALAEGDALTCDSGTIAKLNVELDKLVDPALKEKVDAARVELKAADTALKDNKNDDCIEALKKSLAIVPGTPTK